MVQGRSVVWGFVVLLSGLGWQGAALAAQPWQGPLALAVEVHNEQGQPVPGAKVTLELAEVEPYEGPPTVTTDEDGQAVTYGLAEGLWRVQVEREGYSRYLAVIRLDAKKKRVVVTAGPLRDATAPPLTVDYSKTEARRVAPRVEEPRERDRRAERRREPPREEPAKRQGPAEEPRPRAEPERRVPPATAAPEAEPEPEPEPKAEPAEPAPAEAEPAPASRQPAEPQEPKPEPRAEPAPEPYEEAPAPPPEPEPAEPAPEPAPRTETSPLSPADAPPEPEAQPTLPPSPVRSTANGTCSDCKPGEAAVSVRFRAASRAAGEAGCSPDVDERVRQAIEWLAAEPVAEAGEYVGPLVDEGRVLPWAEPEAVARAQDLLDRWVSPTSACQVAVAVLSPRVRFTGYRYQAADAQAGGDCLASQECPIGDAVWPEHPGIEKTEAGTFVFSVFENQSAGWERRGEMIVYFEP